MKISIVYIGIEGIQVIVAMLGISQLIAGGQILILVNIRRIEAEDMLFGPDVLVGGIDSEVRIIIIAATAVPTGIATGIKTISP